ncbi:DegT/DnrJ/EryC1/StrS aminotransferase family protein [Acidisphaera sp. L21]|uniref:DegT/DnrJ/EryC1/StrS family aminotransferase n=1 Tax=Acidisphaera sp. L21 TaxID=1641851 RepID=UPI001C206F56|nr:DegT/DnrJ/EryC1/StrS family aminotransferase [Acidisphaera sp. L21]
MRQNFHLNPAVPVARPLLPKAEALMPYLQRIDASRTYTNFGPLVHELEDRLTQHYRVPPGSIATVSNATQGLTLALQAQGPRKGSLCLMPAWSFAASAHSVVNAGLRPHFLDVEPHAGLLTPEHVLQVLAQMPPGRVGAVMPVAAFGHPVDVAAWDRFHEQTRIPVVIDAAAGFDSLRPGRVPSVISLHATKIMPAGEGGLVIARDKALIVDIERRSNFGFMGGREARVAATNAKMNEYNAAVALAALDDWPGSRARFVAIAEIYARLLRRIPGVTLLPGYGITWISATVIVAFAPHHPPTDDIVNSLADAGVATRRWWCRGLHEEDAFSDCGREELPATNRWTESTLGLPCFVDMTRGDIARVCHALSGALATQNAGELVVAA